MVGRKRPDADVRTIAAVRLPADVARMASIWQTGQTLGTRGRAARRFVAIGLDKLPRTAPQGLRGLALRRRIEVSQHQQRLGRVDRLAIQAAIVARFAGGHFGLVVPMRIEHDQAAPRIPIDQAGPRRNPRQLVAVSS